MEYAKIKIVESYEMDLKRKLERRKMKLKLK
jgi:hypothetical protein